jgi:hypothetical protein
MTGTAGSMRSPAPSFVERYTRLLAPARTQRFEMSQARRIRGLVGTAITWGVIGALVGIPAYIVAMRPWPLSAIRWQRLWTTFAMWEAVAVVWGIAGGLAFGFAVMALARTRRLSQLSLTRVAALGALGGGLLPAVLVWPNLLGSNSAYFGAIIGAGALGGAIWARMSPAIARRAPENSSEELLHSSTRVGAS